MRRIARFTLLAGAIAIVASVAAPAGASSNAPLILKSGKVLGSGSDTTQFMMNSLDSLYRFTPGCQQVAASGQTQPLDFSCILPDPPNTITTENYAHDQVTEASFLGSSNGINQLCEQGQAGVALISFARSSRAPRIGDCTGMNFVAYAKDAIPFEVFPMVNGNPNPIFTGFNNPDPLCAGKGICLTQAQLQGIFVNCSITNWNQVGSTQNAPITSHIYAAQSGSGTRSTFDGFVGGNSQTCITNTADHVINENQNQTIFANGDEANAIFYFSFGVYQLNVVPNPDGSQLGGIDGVDPTTGTIGDGSFPYTRFLYNVYCRSCSSGINATVPTKKYVGEKDGWICKTPAKHANDPLTGVNYATEINGTISGNGFVNIPDGPIGGGVSGISGCRLFTT